MLAGLANLKSAFQNLNFSNAAICPILIENPLTQDSDLSEKTRPGISGKKMLVAFLSSVLLLGGFIAYVLSMYERRDQIRTTTAAQWSTVAAGLDRDYKAIEASFAAESPDWAKQFITQADQFRTATAVDHQSQLAIDLEHQIQSHAGDLGELLPNLTDVQKQEIARYNQLVDSETQFQNTFTGRFLQRLLPVVGRNSLEILR